MTTATRVRPTLRPGGSRIALLALLLPALLCISAAALVAPPAADAHVRKDRQGLYLLAVDRWREMAKATAADAENEADMLTDMADGMRELIPPENDAERALLESYKQTAGEWQQLQADKTVVMVRETQKSINRWERKVKPWFGKAADRRALEKAVDAYMKGYTHLVHESHGGLEDAAAHLKAEELDDAGEDIALAIGGIAFAEQEMKDATAAMGRLLN